MKREELKPVELENNLGKDVNGVVHRVPWKAYDVEEADKVMDAMEARIKELEAEVKKWKQDNRYLTAMIQLMYRGKDANSTAVIAVANKMDNLEAENARLKAQVPKWISVDKELPKDEQIVYVIIKHKNGRFSSPILCCYEQHYGFCTQDSYSIEDDYGHVELWMPLPPPPTTEESSVTEKENG